MNFRPLVLAALCVAAFLPGIAGEFVLDDMESIVKNPQIRGLWPLSRFVTDAPRSTVSGRPVLSFSLALNHACGRDSPLGYHAVNVAVHALAALFLYGIVRRTFGREPLAGRHAGGASRIAFTATLFWMLHPLQVESVTYVIQRAESLMGLFYLGALYAVIRSDGSSRPRAWWGAAGILMLAGVGTKEVAVTFPVVALAYDRVFLAGSFKGALARRMPLYVGLFAAAGIGLCLVVSGNHAAVSAEISRSGETPAWRYALTQPGVILHYVRLAAVPAGLQFDPGWPLVAGWRGSLPALLAVAGLVVASVMLVARGHPAGFPGIWFFAILAPTSSVIPLKDVAFEHRMYLPLAALTTVLAVLVERARFPAFRTGRFSGSFLVAASIAVCLASQTANRQVLFLRAEWVWKDTLRKSPRHTRAATGVGLVHLKAGRLAEAERVLWKAVAIDGAYALTWNALGDVMIRQGRLVEALRALDRALVLKPDLVTARSHRAGALVRLGALDEAEREYGVVLARDPRHIVSLYNLGNIRISRGDPEGALIRFREILAVDPGYADAHRRIARILEQKGMHGEAARHLAEAERLETDR